MSEFMKAIVQDVLSRNNTTIVNPPASAKDETGNQKSAVTPSKRSGEKTRPDLLEELRRPNYQREKQRAWITSKAPLEKITQQELSGFKKVEITYLTDLPLNELIAKTRSLPPDSVILYVWQQSINEQGKLLDSHQVLSRIAPGSSAPIYGFGTGLLGFGIVGGYLHGPEMNGAKAAELVERILNGTPVGEIPVEQSQKVPMFDWRELQRWRVLESSLPPDSVVRFKEFTFWELYKRQIVGVIALLILQSAFIAVLLVERRRRRRAKEALDRLNAELEERIAARTAALHAKSRELEAFAYSVAHDLKAPLRGIDGYSQLLLEEYAKNLDDEGRSFLQTIQQATDEMNQLIDDILAYSRLERRELKSDRIELRPMINSLVEEKKRETAERQIDFKIDVNGATVLGDGRRQRHLVELPVRVVAHDDQLGGAGAGRLARGESDAEVDLLAGVERPRQRRFLADLEVVVVVPRPHEVADP